MEKLAEDDIQVRAYDIWLEAGRPLGRQEEFWHQAEKELGDGSKSDEEAVFFF